MFDLFWTLECVGDKIGGVVNFCSSCCWDVKCNFSVETTKTIRDNGISPQNADKPAYCVHERSKTTCMFIGIGVI
jgi:hypothetical protein